MLVSPEEEEEEEANCYGLSATTQTPPAQGEEGSWEWNQAAERGLEEVEWEAGWAFGS